MAASSRIGRSRSIVLALAVGLVMLPSSTDAGASGSDADPAECRLAASSSAIVDWGDDVSGRLIRSTKRGVRVDVGLRSEASGVALCDRNAHVQIWRIGIDRQLVVEGPVQVLHLADGDLVHRYDWSFDGSGGRAEPGSYEIVFASSRIDVVGVDVSDASRASHTTRGSTLAVRVPLLPAKERVRDIALERRPGAPIPGVPIPGVDVVIIGRS